MSETASERPAATVPFRYKAFISHAHADADAAIRLQKLLERFVLPRALRAVGPGMEMNARATAPVFRDADELVPGADLGERIETALKASEYLIVVCSPAARESRWVNREIEAFAALGRADRILCVVVAGEPRTNAEIDTADECLPPALRAIGDDEPLWVDWRARRHEDRLALLRIVASLLSLQSLDELVLRDQQQRRRQRLFQAALAALLAAALLTAGWIAVSNHRTSVGNRADQLAAAAEVMLDTGDLAGAARLALAASNLSATALLNPPARAEAILRLAAGAGPERDIGTPLDSIQRLDFATDGRTLSAVSNGGGVEWRIADGRVVRQENWSEPQYIMLTDRRGRVRARLDETGTSILFVSLTLFRTPNDEGFEIELGPFRHPSAKALSDDGSTLALGFPDGQYEVYDVETRGKRFTGQHPGSISGIALSADGSSLVVGLRDGNGYLHDRQGRETASMFMQSPIEAIAVSPDAADIAMAADGRIAWWSRSRPGDRVMNSYSTGGYGRLRSTSLPERGAPGPVVQLDFAAQRNAMLVRTAGGALFAVTAGYEELSDPYPIRAGGAALTAAAIAPDGRRIASAVDGRVQLWRVGPVPVFERRLPYADGGKTVALVDAGDTLDAVSSSGAGCRITSNQAKALTMHCYAPPVPAAASCLTRGEAASGMRAGRDEQGRTLAVVLNHLGPCYWSPTGGYSTSQALDGEPEDIARYALAVSRRGLIVHGVDKRLYTFAIDGKTQNSLVLEGTVETLALSADESRLLIEVNHSALEPRSWYLLPVDGKRLGDRNPVSENAPVRLAFALLRDPAPTGGSTPGVWWPGIAYALFAPAAAAVDSPSQITLSPDAMRTSTLSPGGWLRIYDSSALGVPLTALRQRICAGLLKGQSTGWNKADLTRFPWLATQSTPCA